MNIRRSFFFALPLGLLLTGAIYFGLFFLQLGVPTKEGNRMHATIGAKRDIAAAIPRPKLLIVAGSSAFIGISAAEIQRETGFPAVNLGVNAALGPAYTVHLAKQVCRPGDVVLLAFEYEQYVSENATGTTADKLFLQYVLGYDRGYVRGLSLGRQIRLALLTPGEQLRNGLLAAFRKPKPDTDAPALKREVLSEMNGHGDAIGAVPDRRPAISATRTHVSPSLASGLPDSPPGFAPIREFCEWAHSRDITVLATFPTIFHHADYDIPPAQKTPRQLHDFYASLGVPLLGTARDAMLSEDQLFDTNYHPLQSAALAHTRRLLVHLAPHLRPRPATAR